MNKKTNGLYIALFICSTLVLTMVFYINNADLKSIILGIGTGGLTSALVAFLIEKRDNEWLEKEKQAKCEVVILEYVDIYKRLSLFVATECHGLYERNESHTFSKWIDLLIKNEDNFPQTGQSSMKRRCTRISSNLALLRDTTEHFKSQNAILIYEGTEDMRDILEFFSMQSLECWGAIQMLEKSEYKAFLETTKVLYNQFVERFPGYTAELKENYPIDSEYTQRIPYSKGGTPKNYNLEVADKKNNKTC